VRRAPQAAPAREFIEWIGSPAAQRLASERAFKLPARTDIAAETLPAWAREALAQLRPASFDRALVEREAAGWMTEWDRAVRNRGSER
jgi:ABC-type thiamine transport system substrate-binding protein